MNIFFVYLEGVACVINAIVQGVHPQEKKKEECKTKNNVIAPLFGAQKATAEHRVS